MNFQALQLRNKENVSKNTPHMASGAFDMSKYYYELKFYTLEGRQDIMGQTATLQIYAVKLQWKLDTTKKCSLYI